jgi:hypothetical protein
METKISQAQISAPIVVNQANAKVNATIATNLAQMKAFLSVTTSESAAYKLMKTELTFTNLQLLTYIKQKTIGNYNKDMLLNSISTSLTKKV